MSDKTVTESKDYRERPAGVNDRLELNSCQMSQIFKGDEEKATKKNAKTSVTKPSQINMVYSTELQEGMTIPVSNGGKPQEKDGESR